ncbi:hypothetical protein M0805_008800 [Coniferiporia weirii]|nr:hypothetical protein M0805_008800 [Coniferiporia weirii]
MAIVTSATQRVIGIPEILDLIFSHNHPSQNIRCARVNRSWSNVALDYVWRENPPLKALFQLLAPLVPLDNLPQTERSTLVFSRPIGLKDWARFLGLARRVKVFSLTSLEMDLMADSVFMRVSMTRPAVSILPNLEKLFVRGRLIALAHVQYSYLFLRESITFFSFTSQVRHNPDIAEEVRSLLNEVLHRSPNVTQMELSIGPLLHVNFRLERTIRTLSSRLRNLKTLRLPPPLLSAPVLDSIALLPNLTDIDMSPFSIYEDEDIDSPLPDTDSAFRSLRSLSMQGDLKMVTRLFSSRVFPLGLITFTLRIVDENRASDFRSCLKALAHACPELKKLKFFVDGEDPGSPESGPLTAQDLSPLTSFPLLETFELRYDRAVSMSDEELICIVKRCPSLRHLDLNSVFLSAETEATSLTLGFLALLVKESAAVKLEYLAIYVNALSTDGLPEVEGCLENMRYISFGVSPISEPSDKVLLYLSRLVPATCTFDVGLGSELDNMWVDEDEISGRRSIWGNVKRILALLTEVRLEERESKRAETIPATASASRTRVICIPEVLDLIFEYSEKADNARCARVNRAWSEIALNHVWCEYPPLKALFQLLAPLVVSGDRSQSPSKLTLIFARVIYPNDWKRLNSYATRVKKLSMTTSEMGHHNRLKNTISNRVFTEVALSRPIVHILPQLEVLHVAVDIPTSWLRYALLFLHKSVSLVSLALPADDRNASATTRSLLNEIHGRSPEITELQLQIPSSVKNIENELCHLLSGLRHLERLFLSPCLLTTPVINSIALLPNLMTVRSLIPRSGGSVTDIMQFEPPRLNNAFMSLHILEMQGQLTMVNRFFSSKMFPLQLHTLIIDMVAQNHPSDLRPCLDALAASCSRLSSLAFVLSRDPFGTRNAEPITAHALTPLICFPLLETFQLEFYEPVSMADDELVDIIKMIEDLPEVEGYLEDMCSISFGTSPTPVCKDSLLSYLSCLIPTTCKLDVDKGLDEQVYEKCPPSLAAEMEKRRSVWENIGETLPLLTKIRQDERDRANKRAGIRTGS